MKTVAEFEIPYRQILGERGELVTPLPEFANDPGELLRMHRAMTLVRVGAAMRPEDVLAPVYREFARKFGAA